MNKLSALAKNACHCSLESVTFGSPVEAGICGWSAGLSFVAPFGFGSSIRATGQELTDGPHSGRDQRSTTLCTHDGLPRKEKGAQTNYARSGRCLTWLVDNPLSVEIRFLYCSNNTKQLYLPSLNPLSSNTTPVNVRFPFEPNRRRCHCRRTAALYKICSTTALSRGVTVPGCRNRRRPVDLPEANERCHT